MTLSSAEVYPEIQDKIMQTSWQGIARNECNWSVYNGDASQILTDLQPNSVNCVVTSPPYFWLRNYDADNQIGHEDTVNDYVNAICAVMKKTFDVLSSNGLLFLNIGDTYYSGKGESQGTDPKSRKRRFGIRAVDRSGGLGIGLKPKSSIGIPWRVAIKMSENGWTLRSPIVWYRKHCLPESVADRPRRSYEHIFMFSKNRQYYFNRQPLMEAGEEDMWTIAARPKDANGLDTAPFPDELVQRCLNIGCLPGGTVLDPFAGSGTTLRVAINSNRPAIGIDINSDFCKHIVKELERL